MNPARRAYRACLRAGQEILRLLGLNVAQTRDYYSPLPVRTELVGNRARWDRPSELIGLQWDLDAMRELNRELVSVAVAELDQLPSYEEAKGLGYGPGFTEHDALWLYAMLRRLRPARYLEVGSGLSTWYASKALERNAAEGSPSEITVIDPHVSSRVRELDGLRAIAEPVQDAGLEPFERLEAGDVLFIDTTHVVRIDGDVPFLYLEAVPRLAPGVTVHAHDIHFPYNTPHPAQQYVIDAKWPRYWTEAMLLQAFLAFNRDFEIVFSPALLRHFDEEHLRSVVPRYRPLEIRDHDTHFGSFWFRRTS